MIFVWMFTMSPFISMFCVDNWNRFHICSEIYHCKAEVAMFFFAANHRAEANSASAGKPRKMMRPPFPTGRR
jgi:hypothetical protein